MNDYGKYPPGYGHEWRGNWGARLFDILRSHGFETLTAFAHTFPLATLDELTSKIGDGDVAPIQLQWILVEEAREAGTLRQCAKDLLVRLLREVKVGWPSDRSWEAQEDVRSLLVDWQVSFGKEYDAVLDQMANDLLDTLDLPPGWLPSGPEDPVITALFAQYWPEESGDPKPAENVGRPQGAQTDLGADEIP